MVSFIIQAKSTKVLLNQENEKLRMALYDLGLKNNAVQGKLELSALKTGEQIVIVSGSGENGPSMQGMSFR